MPYALIAPSVAVAVAYVLLQPHLSVILATLAVLP